LVGVFLSWRRLWRVEGFIVTEIKAINI